MSSYCTPSDRESLHTFLAGSIIAQENGVELHSLSDLLDLQQSIAIGEFDLDRAIYLIAGRARAMANATGVAIGLLEGDQLVYEAACGSVATNVGQQMTAILSTSERKRGDILRVEKGQTNNRIAAEICRQFGVNSLLILPIYREGTVAGVLQVLFAEEHTFRSGEMGTYRLIAGLVEEAIWYATHPEEKALAGSKAPQRARWMLLYERRWQVAVATVLVLASLIARDRHAASWVEVSALARSISTHQLEVGAKHLENSRSTPQTVLAPTEQARKAARRPPRWVWVGEKELDYLAPDVTMRLFHPKDPQPRVQRGESQVQYFGEDVTVRYFTWRDTPALPAPLSRSAAHTNAN